MADLDRQILAAHAAGDGAALADLYARAAEALTDEAARAFFLTQALVFALETGHPREPDLREQLREMGREN